MASEVERMNRKVRKRRITVILRSVFIALVAVSAALLAVKYAFRAEKLTVVNATEYDSALILGHLNGLKSSSLVFYDYAKEEKELKSGFPYIESVSFARKYPDGLCVTLIYDEPVYSVEHEDGYLCLDRNLKVLETVPEMKSGTILILGMGVEEYGIGNILDPAVNFETVLISDIEHQLAQSGLSGRVSVLDFSKKYNISFILDGIITVELGNSSDLDAKFKVLLEILRRNPEQKKAVINVHDSANGRYMLTD